MAQGSTAGQIDETELRMELRRGLHAVFHDPQHASSTPGWRWLGRVLGKGRLVVPVDLTRDDLELALAELNKLRAARAAASEARAA